MSWTLLLGVVLCAGCNKPKGKATEESAAAKPEESRATDAELRSASPVDIASMLADYRGDENAAATKYRGKWIKVSGKVRDVRKTELPYVIVGTGSDSPLEIPALSCDIALGDQSKLAAVAKGQPITVVGKVSELLIHVHLESCAVMN